MQPILTVEQILAMFKGYESSLRMVQATPEYMKLEASERSPHSGTYLSPQKRKVHKDSNK
jgi:hypothetical protein